jgi:hypothetical protein
MIPTPQIVNASDDTNSSRIEGNACMSNPQLSYSSPLYPFSLARTSCPDKSRGGTGDYPDTSGSRTRLAQQNRFILAVPR